jgi:hypothetical protein
MASAESLEGPSVIVTVPSIALGLLAPGAIIGVLLAGSVPTSRARYSTYSTRYRDRHPPTTSAIADDRQSLSANNSRTTSTLAGCAANCRLPG